MASPVFVIGRLTTTSPAVRDEYIKRLTAIATYSRENEPEDTVKYAVCIPRDEDESEDGKVCWVVEEYADQAALDRHMAAPITQEMISWISSGSVLGAPPQIWNLQQVDSYSFTKSAVSSLKNPHISFARIEYQPGKREEALPYWKATFAETQEESGTFMYQLLLNENESGMAVPREENVLYTFQIYESEQYLREVHLKENKAVQESKKTIGWSVGVKHHVLSMVDGWWTK